jgi:hypothetical protein
MLIVLKSGNILFLSYQESGDAAEIVGLAHSAEANSGSRAQRFLKNCKRESSARLRDISGTLNVSPGIIILGG